ncbi:MAG: ATP-binding cassette domain-containing protein [Gammaproteobacteria bacterium]|nr:MAG: ATP-binding cassette domain-containing protein [Gammaproteobacteria bacterium]
MTAPLLSVRDLAVTFHLRGGLLRPTRHLKAVNGVSFDIAPGETLAVVGESGSGKSTMARAVMRLVEPSAGSIHLDGDDITALRGEPLRRIRPKLQMVFQDPYSSLDPSMIIADVVGEPLTVHGVATGADRDERVQALLEQVGLGRYHMNRYPYEFSGGQRQRIAIARAIALQPKLLVLDEAVSALDVSTQNQILNLLEDLRRELGIAYLFISHDLGVVEHIADRVAVTYLGRIVEEGPTERIFAKPAHPYTEALLSAVPIPNPRIQRSRQRIVLPGDVPSPLAPPPGCPFHTRCPHVMDVCKTVMPAHTPMAGGGSAACYLHDPQATEGGRRAS